MTPSSLQKGINGMGELNSIPFTSIKKVHTLARIATARPRPTPSDEPLPFIIGKQQRISNIKNTKVNSKKNIEVQEIEYLDSRFQTLEHGSVLKHIWDDHEPVTIHN